MLSRILSSAKDLYRYNTIVIFSILIAETGFFIFVARMLLSQILINRKLYILCYLQQYKTDTVQMLCARIPGGMNVIQVCE